MKRLIIIVEGQTEEEFVKEILAPYLQNFEIYDVSPIKIATSSQSKGGFVNYQHLKNDVMKRSREKDVVITTFVDFFRIPTSIPNYGNCIKNNISIDDKIACLENGMNQDIPFRNFFAYIQKHEFEALLFSSNKGFEEFYEGNIYQETQNIINQFPNPEEINNSPETAPSKRLIKIMQKFNEDYQKVSDGNMIALELGMEIILEKCPRFKSWVEKIISELKKK